jgi:DDE superfamily endonuclease
MKALTGLSYEEFTDLVPSFEQSIITLRMEEPGRQRKVGGGQKGKLKTVEQKLFFILFYLKTYPTFDVLAAFFDRGRGRSCESVHFLTRALEKTLGRRLVLPKRKISSIKEFMEAFPEVKDVFLDGTERRVEKPKKKKRHNKLYSGKKKGTTRKNIIVADEKKRVLVLTPTKSGRRHDKRLADKVLLAEHIPKDVTAWTDTGFKGIERVHGNTLMPHKATKKKPLTDEQRQENRLISHFRVTAEHAIAGIKRLRSVSDVYRNKKANFDDTFMLLAAGIWNFHLQQTV